MLTILLRKKRELLNRILATILSLELDVSLAHLIQNLLVRVIAHKVFQFKWITLQIMKKLISGCLSKIPRINIALTPNSFPLWNVLIHQ